MGLIYRAHFGMIKNPRITSKGLNTAAIYGFTNTLLGVLDRQNPSHLAAVMDCAAPTFRHLASEQYKSHREAQPEDISLAIPYIRRILEAFNIRVLQVEGYEADDVIGTMSVRAIQEGFFVYLMSSDKDFAQLLTTDKIFIYKPGFSANQEVQCLSQKDILANWDIENVGQVCDILGLQGDASDNIAGVPKIGPKTANKLIKAYGSIENLLANTSNLTGNIKDTLEIHADQALLSKQLATICTSAPLNCTCDELFYPSYNKEKLKDIFEELEFRSLLKRMFGTETNQPSSESIVGLPDSIFNFDSKQINSIKSIDHTYVELKDEDHIKKIIDNACKKDAVSFFIHRKSIQNDDSEILGIAFSFVPNTAYYIPINQFIEDEKIKNHIRKLFSYPSICKVSSDIKSSIHILNRYNIAINNNFFDTYLANSLINTESPRLLSALVKNYLQYDMLSFGDLINDQANDCTLACETADILLQLYSKLILEIKDQELSNLFFNVEMPIIPILAEVEENGVAINSDILKVISKEMELESEILSEQIQNIANEKFNVASPKQLGIILFEKLKLVDNPLKTSSGQYVTNEEILQNLVSKHFIVEKILEYRELQKLKSTYVDALPRLVSPKDNLLHTTYNQSVVITGRLSSTNPNLQNIPIKTERGRQLRKAFIARDSYNLLLTADYSQIELRIMASMSEDPTMMQAFDQKKDIHAITASKIFHVTLDEVNNDMRRKAKTANFGIIYGISPFGLAKRLNITKNESAEIINAYFHEFPAVKKYMDETILKAKELGYVSTLLGRRQYLRDINSRNAVVRGHAERNAINMPIQGTAAEMMKLAMIDVSQWIKSEKLRAKMIMQVHDELIFDIPSTELLNFQITLPKLMISAMQIKVPIEINMAVGKNWYDMQKI